MGICARDFHMLVSLVLLLKVYFSIKRLRSQERTSQEVPPSLANMVNDGSKQCTMDLLVSTQVCDCHPKSHTT
jgi:hypothetical protein